MLLPQIASQLVEIPAHLHLLDQGRGIETMSARKLVFGISAACRRSRPGGFVDLTPSRHRELDQTEGQALWGAWIVEARRISAGLRAWSWEPPADSS